MNLSIWIEPKIQNLQVQLHKTPKRSLYHFVTIFLKSSNLEMPSKVL